MQYRVLRRDTLGFVAGGAVRAISLDFDYIADNESSIEIIAPLTDAAEGDIIALIEGHGAYALGCITSIDNEARKVSFKDLRELFNDKIVNPFLGSVVENEVAEKYEVVGFLCDVMMDTFSQLSEGEDRRRVFPLRVETYGVCAAVWEDTAELVDLAEYIKAIFEKHNVVLRFAVDFDRAARNEALRSPKIVVTVEANTNHGGVIKDNILLNEFDNSANALPDANTCIVFQNGTPVSEFYLLADNTVTNDPAAETRILPRKTTSAKYDPEKSVSQKELAEEQLIGKVYNHFISSKLDKASKLLDRREMFVGDRFTIMLASGRAVESVFSGWKDSGDRYVTLVFGKVRIDFTDKLKALLRRKK